jgi:hypothetical protein
MQVARDGERKRTLLYRMCREQRREGEVSCHHRDSKIRGLFGSTAGPHESFIDVGTFPTQNRSIDAQMVCIHTAGKI